VLFSRKKMPAPDGDLPGPFPAYPQEILEATLRVPDLGDANGELLDLTARGASLCLPTENDPVLASGEVVELLFGRARRPRVSSPARVVCASAFGEGLHRYDLEFIDEGDLLPQLEDFCRASFNRRGGVRLPMKGRHVGVSLWWAGGRCTATVSDLSKTGLGFSAPLANTATLEQGQRVCCYFRLPGVSRPLEGSAIVRHAVKLEGRRLFGLEFDLEDPAGLSRRMPEIRNFITRRAEELDAWEAGWSEGA
jgi:hypothetical protein